MLPHITTTRTSSCKRFLCWLYYVYFIHATQFLSSPWQRTNAMKCVPGHRPSSNVTTPRAHRSPHTHSTPRNIQFNFFRFNFCKFLLRINIASCPKVPFKQQQQLKHHINTHSPCNAHTICEIAVARHQLSGIGHFSIRNYEPPHRPFSHSTPHYTRPPIHRFT